MRRLENGKTGELPDAVQPTACRMDHVLNFQEDQKTDNKTNVLLNATAINPIQSQMKNVAECSLPQQLNSSNHPVN
jgi:hypothetical protein